MLHCGNEFQMETCSSWFKFDDMAQIKGRISSSFFLGAFKYAWFGT